MNRQAWRRRLPVMLSSAAILVLAVFAVFYLRDFLSAEQAPAKKVVQEVRIIRPPPPPLEPPPPPPPMEEEEVDVPDPQPEQDVASDEPPPGDLGIDAVGEGAGDGFGLVGRPNGRDILASRSSAYGYYAGLLKNAILDCLGEDKEIRAGRYTVTVRVWVSADGRVREANVIGSSGDRQRDRIIERVLAQMPTLKDRPPSDMPQPITLRIESRT